MAKQNHYFEHDYKTSDPLWPGAPCSVCGAYTAGKHDENDRSGTWKSLSKGLHIVEIAEAWLDKSDHLAASLPADQIVRRLLDHIREDLGDE